MSAIIEVENLTKSYGSKRGIIDVSFQVEAGEVFGFLGPNGAGKTTTIRTLMALLKADAGTARIAGLDCWQQPVQIKRLLGYLPTWDTLLVLAVAVVALASIRFVRKDIGW